jgi:ABC-type branched-subunit amino acid transport system ATPase component
MRRLRGQSPPAGGAESVVLTDVNAWYGRAQALFDVTLELRPRELVGLLGRNGAGKSTVMRSIMSAGVRRTGTVSVAGADVGRLKTYQIARRGVSWVPDDRRVFGSLSVRENLELARRAAGSAARLSVDDMVDAFPMLSRLLPRSGRQLSGGEQQVVAIARGLVVGPSVLLIDEPTEGLAPTIVEQLITALRKLPADFEVSVLIAEENVRTMLALTDTFYALDVGRVVFDPRRSPGAVRTVDDALALLGLR